MQLEISEAYVQKYRLYAQWPKLKNLSNTEKCIQCFKIQAGAQLKSVFGEFETRLKLIKFGLRLFLSHNSPIKDDNKL